MTTERKLTSVRWHIRCSLNARFHRVTVDDILVEPEQASMTTAESSQIDGQWVKVSLT